MTILDCALLVARMKREQWMHPDSLRGIQEDRLKALIRHCASDVPGYRGCDVRAIDDLAGLGILSKQEIRDSPGKFISKGTRGGLERHSTSGSTGVPLSVYQTRDESAHAFALEAHQLTEAGLSPLFLHARIGDQKPAANIVQRLGIFRSRHMRVQDDIALIHRRLLAIKPDALSCYPSIMLPLAKLDMAQGGKLRLPLAFSVAEKMTAQARKTISAAFACDLRDIYGTVETSWLAWECEKGGMHVHPSAIIEVVDARGRPVREGEEGDILVTPLWKKAMPLIRYRIGDRGALGQKCRCGRSGQVLASISGREDDQIVLPSGAMVSARAINLLDDVEGVLEYQIVQEAPERIVFRYRPLSRPIGKAERERITRTILQGCRGEGIAVEFEETGRIVRGGRGKLRTVVSKVRPPAMTL